MSFYNDHDDGYVNLGPLVPQKQYHDFGFQEFRMRRSVYETPKSPVWD